LKSLRFFLLDLGEETTSQGSEIWLWGIDDDGKIVLLVDRSFRPYLYAIPKEGSAPETIFDALRSSGIAMQMSSRALLRRRSYLAR
jgi:hypothetical protein